MIMRILATIGTICAGGAIILVIVAIVAAVKETLREELPIDIYLFFMREAYIESLSTTDEGKEYLNNCWRLEQTKPDRENIRRNFEKRG